MSWNIVAFYRFVALADLPDLRTALDESCRRLGICGTILLAPEGINGTIGGQGTALDEIMDLLDRRTGLRQGEVKFSAASEKPFQRMKVRLKKEIITMKAPEADPTKKVGAYVSAAEWNALISNPDVLVLDTRNDYETKVGLFKGAMDPNIKTFTAFKDFVQEKLDPGKHKKVAMYCTGGIRCEKASSYMLAHGFEKVYHLKGGILKYLEDVAPEQSLWDGECFVFDKRVTLAHGLEEGAAVLCYGCRAPLSDEDRAQPSYEEGVSCPYCIAQLTPQKAASLRMRQSQMTRERARG